MPDDAVLPDSVEWDLPRSSVACRHLLEAAARCGLSTDDCLAGTALSPADIASDSSEVQAGQELTLIRNVLARISDPREFARDVGLQYNFANMGVLGYALLASPTIGDAVNIACRYAALSSTFLRLTRRDSEDGVSLVFDDSAVPADVRAFMLVRDLFALSNTIPLLIGQLDPGAVIRVELPSIEFPADELEFGPLTAEFETSATRLVITFPNHLLEWAMPAADVITAETCARQCEELLQVRRRRRGISARVRARLVRDPGLIPTMAAIADELCTTERTLHRRLAGERTSYRQLVDEVRVTLASELLASGCTVAETARQLGYSETAAFTRAYTRWAGEPPSRHRRR